MLAHVFQLFTQAHPAHQRAQGGLGLGLALVRALVECHGGTVTGDSAGLGQGSQFTVRLPRSRLRPAVAEGQGGRRPARACRVVVVEDEADARDAMRAVLEVEGHSVASVGEGGAALEAAAAVRPEVMFIDLELPGMDGCELARRLRAGGFEHVCLVAVTGHGQPEDRRRTREAGFDAHLVKPVAPEQLFDVIAGVLAPEA
jgi:CheY-like chemotaxis protein